MRKQTIFVVVSVVCGLGLSLAWLNLSKQPAEIFVEKWSQSFEQAEEKCRTAGHHAALECAEWAALAPIYNSGQFLEMENWLTPACERGDGKACARLRLIAEARLRTNSPWLTALGSSLNGIHWPLIELAQKPLSSSEWLESALLGAVSGPNAKIDMFCGELAEVGETLVCTVQDQLRLNQAIGRIVTYVEQGYRVDSVSRHKSNALNRFWQGVDLQRKDFLKAAALLREVGPVAPDEEKLWSWLESRQWKVFLAFNAYSVFTGVPSHEFLHALYFLNSDFRMAVRSSVEPNESQLKRLSQFVTGLYDTKDQFILSNEMQAYLLEYGSTFRDVKGARVVQDIMNALPLGFDKNLIFNLQQGY